MIDLLFVIALFATPMVWIAMRMRLRTALLASCSLAFLFFGICLTCLYTQSPAYDYTLYPSQAAAAGLKGEGRVNAANGSKVTSLGELYSLSLWEKDLRVDASTSFTRSYEPSGWKFWTALDSYALEESTGLGLLPRRPIYRGAISLLRLHFPNFQQNRNWRLIEAHGQATPSIGSLLRELNPLPVGGILLLRMMKPTPDNAVASLLFSPKAFDFFPGLELLPREQAAQLYFGFSGLPILLRRENGWRMHGNVLQANAQPIYGPKSFRAALRGERESHILNIQNHERPFAAHSVEAFAQPRLALLPWLHGNVLVSLVLSVPGAFARQLLALPNLAILPAFGKLLPMQSYLLDDSMGASFYFFKLASLFVSLGIALLLVAALVHWRALFERQRGKLVFLFVLLLQVADLFVIHRFWL